MGGERLPVLVYCVVEWRLSPAGKIVKTNRIFVLTTILHWPILLLLEDTLRKNQTYLLSKEAIEVLAVRARITGRKKSQLVERAIMRAYGKEKP